MPDCNATAKDRGKLKICSLSIHHEDDHQDGDYEWPQTGVHEPKRFVTGRGEERGQ